MDLLEREPIVTKLLHLLRQAGTGQGTLLLLGGEAGIGKSSVLRRFSDEARAMARLHLGHCDAISTPRPLGPLFDLDQPWLERLLGESVPRDTLYRAVLSFLGEGSRPTALMIEDAQWADEATLDLLRFLGRRVASSTALIIVTYREEEIGPRHPFRGLLGDLATASGVERFTLPPLSVDGIRALAQASGLDALALHERTGGNPFFVTELLASAAMMPATVRDAILARATRLAPAAWEVLEVAAVIGGDIDPEILQQIAPPAAGALDACFESGMLWHDGQHMTFRHELTREAILASISPTRLTVLHADALRVLAAHPGCADDHARLAHHAEGARDHRAVLRHAPEAARRASLLRAHREAADQYARALRFTNDLPREERARLLEARSHECYLTAQIDESIMARREALTIWREVGDSRKEGENRCHLAILLWTAAQSEEANHEVTAAISLLEPLPPGPDLALAYATLARLRGTILDDAEAIDWGERAITLAEAQASPEILADALITVGVARLARGSFAEGLSQLERSIEIATDLGLDDLAARAYANLGFGYDEHYRFAQAAQHYERGIQFCLDRDLDRSRQHMTAWLARCQFFLGQWAEAESLAAEVLAARDLAAVTQFVALLVAGMVRMRRGDPGAAPLLDDALALASASGSLYRLGPVRAARAEAAFMAGDSNRVVEEAEAAYDLALSHQQRWYAGELAYWRWKAGGSAVSANVIAEPFARQIAGDWQAAAAIWDELDCPFEAARARAESDDESVLRHALGALESLGARPAAAAVRKRLRAQGARGIPRGPRPSTRANVAGLTARERDILLLLAEGHSNQAIADRLFLSSRTVENHVARVLSKLGAETRAEAVTAARHAGVIPQSE